VSHRPVAIVAGLTLGDYLLWNWSLNGNHDVLALVSGLTLPPLALACVVLLALSLARLISDSAQRSQLRISRRAPGADEGQKHRRRRSATTAEPMQPAAQSSGPAPAQNQAPVSASSSAPASGKRAA
jgi:hypothetical protein